METQVIYSKLMYSNKLENKNKRRGGISVFLKHKDEKLLNSKLTIVTFFYILSILERK